MDPVEDSVTHMSHHGRERTHESIGPCPRDGIFRGALKNGEFYQSRLIRSARNEESARDTPIKRCEFRVVRLGELEKMGIGRPRSVMAPFCELV